MEAESSSAAASSFLGRHEFLIRRLHSLSGLIPVGAYMVVHLVTNASVLNGAATFQDQVDRIHSLGMALPFVEWTFIFIPILFHAILGVVIIRGGLPNTMQYRLAGNVRYMLQRITGMIAFVYIVFHVLNLHWLGAPLAEVAPNWFHRFNPQAATSSAAAALQFSVLIQVFYAVGVLACVFHLANGLWTMGITWGVWTSPVAQRRANYLCGAFGVVLAAVGLGALWGIATANIERAKVVEEVRQQQHEEEQQRIQQALDAEKTTQR